MKKSKRTFICNIITNCGLTKLTCFTISLLLVGNLLFAQHANWTAKLPQIPETGFYQIFLAPDVLSKADNKLNRIRIYDGPIEVPYLIKRQASTSTTKILNVLPIISRYESDTSSSFIFSNIGRRKLATLYLTIKQAWVTKNLKISGSDDQTQWYIVRSRFQLDLNERAQVESETSKSYSIDLPVTDYKYYRIESSDLDELSLNILSIGYFSQELQTQKLAGLPAPKIERIKKPEVSADLFKISFNGSYRIDRLSFNITGPHLFQRNARLYNKNPYKKINPQKGQSSITDSPLADITLSSKDSIKQANVNGLTGSSFFLLVENNDNPSLSIESVKGFQEQHFIKIYLKKGNEYRFTVGGESLKIPEYDLSNFDEASEKALSILKLGNLTQQTTSVAQEPESFFKNKIWIWAGLLFVAGFLVYMCIQMVREMGQKCG
jgi:hypothetical protein